MHVLSDISIILLACEAFVLVVAPLVLFGGLVYALWQLLRHENLPRWLGLARSYLSRVQGYVESAMRSLIKPILLVNSTWATAQVWLSAIMKLPQKCGINREMGDNR
mgnify:CR=1 FL=1